MIARNAVSQLGSVAARRICLIKPSALGDIVQTLPLLGALRGRFPDATIDWVVNREFAPLLAGHPELAGVIPFDRHGGWMCFVRLLRALRQRQFDLVLDMQGLLRSAVMTLATRAPCRVGLQTAREGAAYACHVTIPETSREIPARDRWRSVAVAFGGCGSSIGSGLVIAPAAREWASEILRPLPRPILAVHAGAGWETKRWPAEKFAAVAARFPGSIVAVGSRAEAPLAERIVGMAAGAGRRVLDLAGATTLPRLAALLEAVDLVLSNDSGPMHLAAAAGTPVVGIFTCTSPAISGPAGAGHELVAANVPCAASYCKRCPHGGHARLSCFAEIPVERVVQAVERVIARAIVPRRSA